MVSMYACKTSPRPSPHPGVACVCICVVAVSPKLSQFTLLLYRYGGGPGDRPPSPLRQRAMSSHHYHDTGDEPVQLLADEYVPMVTAVAASPKLWPVNGTYVEGFKVG